MTGAFPGAPQFATHGGEGRIPVGGGHTLHVSQLLHCPTLTDTILSFVRLHKDGHHVHLDYDTLGDHELIEKNDRFRIPLSLDHNIISLAGPAYSPFFSDSAGSVHSTRVHLIDSFGADTPRARRAAARDRATTHPTSNTSKEENKIDNTTHTQETGEDTKQETTQDDNTQQTDDTKQTQQTTHTHATLLAHARYGHPCQRKLAQLLAKSGGLGSGVSSLSGRDRAKLDHSCDACSRAKMKKVPFSNQFHHDVTYPGEKLVADVCGPITLVDTLDENGAVVSSQKWYLSLIVDVYSRFVDAQLIPSKDKASDHVISFYHRLGAMIPDHKGLRHFHTDGGTEYNQAERALERRGIKVTRTPVDTPEWNGIVERKNGTILEMTRALLFHASLPVEGFWELAIATAVYTHNRCNIYVGSSGEKTLFEWFYGRPPCLDHFRTFGCKVILYDRAPESKLAPRGHIGVFVGYDAKKNDAYKVWIPAAQRTVTSRHVRFVENEFPFRDGKMKFDSGSLPTVIALFDSSESTDGNEEMEPTAVAEEATHMPGDRRDGPAQQMSISMNDSIRFSNKRKVDNDLKRPWPNDENSAVADETKLDKRTRNKLQQQQQRQEQQEQHTNKQQRRQPERVRTQTRQTGLNLDDFGHAVFSIQSSSPSSPSSH